MTANAKTRSKATRLLGADPAGIVDDIGRGLLDEQRYS